MQPSTRELSTNPDGTVTVEAPTVERALATLSRELGPSVEVVAADRATTGGVGGFFAREVFRVTAKPPAAGAPAVERAPVRSEGPGGGIAAVLQQLTDDADAQEGTFGTALRRQMAAAHSVVGGDTEDAASLAAALAELPEDAPLTRAALTAEAAPAAPVVEPADTSPPAAAAATPPAPPVAPESPVVGAPAATSSNPLARRMNEALEAAARGVPSPIAQPLDGEDPVLAGRRAAMAAAAQRRAQRPAAATASPALAPSVRSTPVVDAPRGTGEVAWSLENLLRLGLPAVVTDAVRHAAPVGESAWLTTVAEAVELFCRPLPSGSSVLVGPRAHHLAAATGIQSVKCPEAPPYGGTVALQTRDDDRGRRWIGQVRGDRWLHLVIGDGRWGALLFDGPLAISWVGHANLPEALSLAASEGLVLGFGVSDDRDARAHRATPLDVALTIRGLLPRR